eukprot:3661411-Prymnesium_polylepis.1
MRPGHAVSNTTCSPPPFEGAESDDESDSQSDESDESDSAGDGSDEGEGEMEQEMEREGGDGEVEAVLRQRRRGIREEFLVRWRGEERPGVRWEDTWEPLTNLSPELQQEAKALRPAKKVMTAQERSSRAKQRLQERAEENRLEQEKEARREKKTRTRASGAAGEGGWGEEASRRRCASGGGSGSKAAAGRDGEQRPGRGAKRWQEEGARQQEKGATSE